MKKSSLKTLYKSLELTMYRVRDHMIGKMPRGRGHFNPRQLLSKMHGNKAEKVEILDSKNIEVTMYKKVGKHKLYYNLCTMTFQLK